MKLLILFSSFLILVSSLPAQTVGQYELRKRTATGFTSYGITLTNSQVIGLTGGVPAAITPFDGVFASLTSKPTTLAGYGITDSITAALAASTYEPVLSAGTSAQYYRGDKTWQTLNATAVGLGNVENTALSTWAGTSNITTLGTITTGTWQGSLIAPAYLGTGSSITTKYLRGDGTWQTVSGGSGGITIDTSTITGGVAGTLLYHKADNTVGETAVVVFGDGADEGLNLGGNGGTISLVGGAAAAAADDNGHGGAAGTINLNGGTGDGFMMTGFQGGTGGSILMNGGNAGGGSNGVSAGNLDTTAGGDIVSGTGDVNLGSTTGTLQAHAFDSRNNAVQQAEQDIASATTCDIGAATSDNVRITGTTTITGLGTVSAGVRRYVRFAAALTLTHNGTSLILPNSANITTGVGDSMLAASLGSGNWKVLGYWRPTQVEIGVAASDETSDNTASTTVPKLTFRMPHAMTLTSVRCSLTKAATGATFIVDIHESGTTIMTTNKLTVDDSETTSTTAATAAALTDTALADDAVIEVFIDQVGTTTDNTGEGVKVWLIGTRL